MNGIAVKSQYLICNILYEPNTLRIITFVSPLIFSSCKDLSQVFLLKSFSKLKTDKTITFIYQ